MPSSSCSAISIDAPAEAIAMARQIDLDAYERGVLSGDRRYLGQAITLVESRLAEHRALAQELLLRLLPKAGTSHRIGITGVPGVGKSTFIDAFGTRLTTAGHRVAVLAVDPSSTRTGGSILGDKTRMSALGVDPGAFIRASPTSGTLGGVATATREAIVIVEAAGYDVVLVETVGVGQSEVAVCNMTDSFLVLMLARTGDSLQGIKKGVLELADIVTVNKADGEHRDEARAAARELANALELLHPASAAWVPPVLTSSSLTGEGLDEVWGQIERHRATMRKTGAFESRRTRQQIDWMWSTVDERLVSVFRHRQEVRAAAAEMEAQLADGTITPALAAQRLLAL
jgi:LAO/AO transport system kinase